MAKILTVTAFLVIFQQIICQPVDINKLNQQNEEILEVNLEDDEESVTFPYKTEEELMNEQKNKEEFDKQASEAEYKFSSNINDNINDNQNQREETRMGRKVVGKYSFHDGYFKRTVHYEADENGFRIVKDEMILVGDGPKYNPQGSAQVDTDVAGTAVKYSITAEDSQKKQPGRKENNDEQ